MASRQAEQGDDPAEVLSGIRNLAASFALTSSIAIGVALQGIVKGGAARRLGIALLILSFLVAIKCVNTANNLSGPRPGRRSRRQAWRRYTVGHKDRLGPLSFAAAVAVVVMGAFSVQLNTRPVVSYRSAYDGVDPVHAGCSSDSAGDGTVVASKPVRAGRIVIGTLELEYSEFCGSHWPKLILTRSGLATVRHSPVVLIVRRQADDTVARYALTVQALPYVWGNMVGGGVCADAEVSGGGLTRRLPAYSATTPCRSS